jgi:hypothetical protein
MKVWDHIACKHTLEVLDIARGLLSQCTDDTTLSLDDAIAIAITRVAESHSFYVGTRSYNRCLRFGRTLLHGRPRCTQSSGMWFTVYH